MPVLAALQLCDEVAAVAQKRGCKVTVLEMQPLVLNRVVAPEMSRFYTEVHRAHGVDIAERVIGGDLAEDIGVVDDGAEIVTVIEGLDATTAASAAIAAYVESRSRDLQIECHRGGQPLYPYLFGVE